MKDQNIKDVIKDRYGKIARGKLLAEAEPQSSFLLKDYLDV